MSGIILVAMKTCVALCALFVALIAGALLLDLIKLVFVILGG